MRLYVVEVNDGGAEGDFLTLDTFITRLQRDWKPGRDFSESAAAEIKALDEAMLATVNIAHVGMVIEFRMGWVFCAEDAPGS